MIRGLDESTGRILDKLEQTGLDENTLIIFMSDNGGIDQDVSHNAIGTKNTPFVGGKACLTEGGIRVPLVFRWKGKIEENKWCDIPVDCKEIYPTILQFAGYDLDDYYNELKIDGQSISGLLHDVENKNGSYTKEAHYWHYPFNVIYNSPFDGLPLTPHSAIREKEYKLIFDWYGRLYLFDMEQDPYEKNNLAQQMPKKTDGLTAKLLSWLDENIDDRYLPKINPKYDPEKESRKESFVNLYKSYKKNLNQELHRYEE